MGLKIEMMCKFNIEFATYRTPNIFFSKIFMLHKTSERFIMPIDITIMNKRTFQINFKNI